MSQIADIIVVGTGPAGLSAAIGLARDGRAVTLIGPRPVESDRRTTALMLPAVEFLGTIGLEGVAEELGTPLRAMRIVDGTRRLLRSPAVTFPSHEIGRDAFGYNIANAKLNLRLGERAAAQDAITWIEDRVVSWDPGPDAVRVTLEDGTAISASLAVAADGRMSPARGAAGIRIIQRSLPQSALVLSFGHSRDHNFMSTEFHTETGPCTQVPLAGRRSSLVWVVNPAMAEDLIALDDDELGERIEARLDSILGKVTVEPGRQIYPLSTTLPTRFSGERVILVGEAAHVFPPIGAQGLNLGLRDVRDMLAVVRDSGDDPGAAHVTARYDRLRRPDVTARAAAVNLLNASLLSDLLPAQIARSAGLGALSALPALRSFFMREGMQPGSGIARMASTVREKIGRHDARGYQRDEARDRHDR